MRVSNVLFCGHSREVAHWFLPSLDPWVLRAGGRAAYGDGAPSQFLYNSPKWMEEADEGETLACFSWFIIRFALCLISVALGCSLFETQEAGVSQIMTGDSWWQME